MSGGQKPRTPRYFPRMKVRGARRKQIAPFHRMGYQIDRIGKAFMRIAEQAYEISNIRTIPMKDWIVDWRDPAPRSIAGAGESIMQEDHAEH